VIAMAKFKPLVDSSLKDAEAKVSKYWNDINMLEKTLEKGFNTFFIIFFFHSFLFVVECECAILTGTFAKYAVNKGNTLKAFKCE
jgi:hypothetical protein